MTLTERLHNDIDVVVDPASDAFASDPPPVTTNRATSRALPRAEWRDRRCTWHFD